MRLPPCWGLPSNVSLGEGRRAERELTPSRRRDTADEGEREMGGAPAGPTTTGTHVDE